MTDRKYPWTDHWGVKTLGTLRQYAAQQIDTGWHYSWYWGTTSGSVWERDALHDCRERIESVQAELARLRQCEQHLMVSLGEQLERGEPERAA